MNNIAWNATTKTLQFTRKVVSGYPRIVVQYIG